MNFNLSKSKKVAEDKKSATFQLPDGHKVVVAKHVLSPKMRGEIANLPIHLYENGLVPEKDNPSDSDLEEEDKQLTAIKNEAPNRPEEAMRSNSEASLQFPNVSPAAQMGPPAPLGIQQQAQRAGASLNPDDIFNQRVQEKYNTLLQQKPTKPRSLGRFDVAEEGDYPSLDEASKQSKLKQANQDVLNEMAAEKKQNEFQSANVQKAEEARHANDVAYIESQNAQRVKLGLSPLPLPVSATQAPAAPTPEIKPAAQEEVAPQQAPAPQQQEPDQLQPMFQEHMKAQQDLMDKSQKMIDFAKNNIQALQYDVENNHIDPNRLFANMSTGRKILSVVGLLFGGLGGIAGQPNMAAKMMDDAIRNDIAAQQTDKAAKANLFNSNVKLLNDVPSALHMSYAAQNQILADKLKQMASITQDPNKQFKLLSTASIMEGNSAQALQQIGQRQMLMSTLNQPEQNQGDNMARQIDVHRVIAPEYAKSEEARYIPGVGMAQVPVPEKERSEIIARKNLDIQFKKLEDFAKAHQGSMDPAIINEGKALAALVQDAYRSASGQGVFREAEKEFVEGIIDQNPTKFFADYRTIPKYKTLISDNRTRLTGIAQGYGLPVDKLFKARIKMGPIAQ